MVDEAIPFIMTSELISIWDESINGSTSAPHKPTTGQPNGLRTSLQNNQQYSPMLFKMDRQKPSPTVPIKQLDRLDIALPTTTSNGAALVGYQVTTLYNVRTGAN